MLKISIQGVGETKKKLANIQVNVKKATADAVYKTAFEINETAINLAPVRTGRLKGSIRVSEFHPEIPSASVTANTEYAVYVEYGTRYMAAQPFMRPAAMRGKALVQAITRVEIVKAIKRGELVGISSIYNLPSTLTELRFAAGESFESMEFGENF